MVTGPSRRSPPASRRGAGRSRSPKRPVTFAEIRNIFISRCRRRVKVLIWHLNGYWMLYKRLESQRFQWPDWFGEADTLTLDIEQMDYLLDGYDLNGMRPHREQAYQRHF